MTHRLTIKNHTLRLTASEAGPGVRLSIARPGAGLRLTMSRQGPQGIQGIQGIPGETQGRDLSVHFGTLDTASAVIDGGLL